MQSIVEILRKYLINPDTFPSSAQLEKHGEEIRGGSAILRKIQTNPRGFHPAYMSGIDALMIELDQNPYLRTQIRTITDPFYKQPELLTKKITSLHDLMLAMHWFGQKNSALAKALCLDYINRFIDTLEKLVEFQKLITEEPRRQLELGHITPEDTQCVVIALQQKNDALENAQAECLARKAEETQRQERIAAEEEAKKEAMRQQQQALREKQAAERQAQAEKDALITRAIRITYKSKSKIVCIAFYEHGISATKIKKDQNIQDINVTAQGPQSLKNISFLIQGEVSQQRSDQLLALIDRFKEPIHCILVNCVFEDGSFLAKLDHRKSHVSLELGLSMSNTPPITAETHSSRARMTIDPQDMAKGLYGGISTADCYGCFQNDTYLMFSFKTISLTPTEAATPSSASASVGSVSFGAFFHEATTHRSPSEPAAKSSRPSQKAELKAFFPGAQIFEEHEFGTPAHLAALGPCLRGLPSELAAFLSSPAPAVAAPSPSANSVPRYGIFPPPPANPSMAPNSPATAAPRPGSSQT